ncbi:hypothetical protein [Rhodococcus opacus]|uniref:hypothetical protein n=1 Tax=Rhodococcus opacus TaxID=37919 RepID=UPI003AB07BDA
MTTATVLIIDDEVKLRAGARLPRAGGYTVLEAGDGRRALDLRGEGWPGCSARRTMSPS